MSSTTAAVAASLRDGLCPAGAGRTPIGDGEIRKDNGDASRLAVTVPWPEYAAMEPGDVIVTVEHCHGCRGHRMTTRHDPEVERAAGALFPGLFEFVQIGVLLRFCGTAWSSVVVLC